MSKNNVWDPGGDVEAGIQCFWCFGQVGSNLFQSSPISDFWDIVTLGRVSSGQITRWALSRGFGGCSPPPTGCIAPHQGDENLTIIYYAIYTNKSLF